MEYNALGVGKCWRRGERRGRTEGWQRKRREGRGLEAE